MPRFFPAPEPVDLPVNGRSVTGAQFPTVADPSVDLLTGSLAHAEAVDGRATRCGRAAASAVRPIWAGSGAGGEVMPQCQRHRLTRRAEKDAHLRRLAAVAGRWRRPDERYELGYPATGRVWRRTERYVRGAVCREQPLMPDAA